MWSVWSLLLIILKRPLLQPNMIRNGWFSLEICPYRPKCSIPYILDNSYYFQIHFHHNVIVTRKKCDISAGLWHCRLAFRSSVLLLPLIETFFSVYFLTFSWVSLRRQRKYILKTIYLTSARKKQQKNMLCQTHTLWYEHIIHTCRHRQRITFLCFLFPRSPLCHADRHEAGQ